MKKTVITYTSRKNASKVYVLFSADEQNNSAILIDLEGVKHTMKLTTLRKTFKKSVQEVEVEEPKTEEKPLTNHQKGALENLKGAYDFVVGGIENDLADGNLMDMPSVEVMFEQVYDEAMNSRYGMVGGLFVSGGEVPICMKFAGKAFIREQLAKLFRKDGYEVPEELTKVPSKKQGHSNIVDGERVNIRKDEAEKVVTVRAFTGMLIGTFKVEKETKSTITVKTAKGMLKFDKKTGIQITEKKRFANRIDI